MDCVLGLIAAGQPAVVVTAIDVAGSAPCDAGARLVVGDDKIWGTIGGGNLEFLAIDQSRKLLAQQERRALLQSLPLGPILSQCCGGRVQLLFERFDRDDRRVLERARVEDGFFATTVDPERYARRLLSAEDMAESSTVPTKWGLHAGTWVEPARASPPLVLIFGGGHVGKALAHVLAVAPCEIAIVDAREEIASEIGGNVRLIETDDPATLTEWWRSGALAVIATHSHELDYKWVSAILARDDCRYCGLIGSKTKRARFVRRLRGDGLAERSIARLTCPIGISGLRAKDPGKVAISTAAQLVALFGELASARGGASLASDPGKPA